MRTDFELKNDFNIKQLGAFMAKLTTLAKAAPLGGVHAVTGRVLRPAAFHS